MDDVELQSRRRPCRRDLPGPPRGDERGAGLVEYVLLLTLLALVSLVALTFMGGSVRDVFVAITQRISAAA